MIDRTAETQYGHWDGEAAFDDAATNTITAYAVNAKHIESGQRVVSFKASYIESLLSHDKQIRVSVTTKHTNLSYDEVKKGATLSSSRFELSPDEFFRLFKRANFAVARKGL